MVSAGTSALRNNGLPGHSSLILGDSSASGSITFECDLNSQCPAGQGCNNGVCQSEDCTNNLDDDNDGYVDCGDSDCNAIGGTARICTGSTEVFASTDGNNYYCSYGINDVQDPGEPGYCCRAGNYWDSTLGGCRESVVCGDPIINTKCYYDIGTPEYYADTTNCFNPSSPVHIQACCPVIRFGDLEERDFVNVIIS